MTWTSRPVRVVRVRAGSVRAVPRHDGTGAPGGRPTGGAGGACGGTTAIWASCSPGTVNSTGSSPARTTAQGGRGRARGPRGTRAGRQLGRAAPVLRACGWRRFVTHARTAWWRTWPTRGGPGRTGANAGPLQRSRDAGRGLKLMSLPSEFTRRRSASISLAAVRFRGRNFDATSRQAGAARRVRHTSAGARAALPDGELEVRRVGQRTSRNQEKCRRSRRSTSARAAQGHPARTGEEIDERDELIERYEKKISEARMPDEARERSERELGRLKCSDQKQASTSRAQLPRLARVNCPGRWPRTTNEDIDNAAACWRGPLRAR